MYIYIGTNHKVKAIYIYVYIYIDQSQAQGTLCSVHCNKHTTPQHNVTHCSTPVVFKPQHISRIPHYNTPQHAATRYHKLQHNTEKNPVVMAFVCWCARIATHCNTLQHIATHCNTLQHTDRFRASTHSEYSAPRQVPSQVSWDIQKDVKKSPYMWREHLGKKFKPRELTNFPLPLAGYARVAGEDPAIRGLIDCTSYLEISLGYIHILIYVYMYAYI